MIEIDGSQGGGQMLRTALTLSALKQKNFKMKNIRGSRTNQGLKNQHLKAVKTIQRLTNAETQGAEIGSKKITFKPKTLNQESFTVNIGTAGSTTLLFDTILPLAEEINIRYTAKGGTDVKWSPTFSYFKHIKLPLLKNHGLKAEADLKKTGYYPKGGGEVTLKLQNSEIQPINIEERGKLEKFEIYSKASEELKNQEVADRQADEAARILKNSHITVPIEKNVSYAETNSPGSTLLVKAVYENSIAGFDALGEKGKRSEKVAKEAVQKFKKFHASNATVDKHMADQLMVFAALTKGKIIIPKNTNHVKTSRALLTRFKITTNIQENKNIYLELGQRGGS